MKRINYIILLLAGFNFLNAQVLITAGTSPTPAANAQAVLELYSKDQNKGLLMPKVSLTATNNASPFPSHIAGMTVYNTNTTTAALTGVTPGFYYNNGSSWSKLEVQLPNTGDIKYSSTAPDHDGWYLLNGRAISTLPASVQTRATALGFSTTLPDSTDRYLKSRSASETLGTTGGSSTVTLAQANLPNVTYNATTVSSGIHNHTYNDRASGVTASAEGGSSRTVVDDGSNSSTTSSTGAHAHTFSVSTGGSNTPLSLQPKYLSAYMFVYLGQ
ncbi:hypothetical protein JET18_03065 [Chryseobacterium sp. L7]|uniref:Phage tail collar domain-containing protein n=1 Tax=Chryseobacterium endalhagicum TaxID=2797638 RepID=A0ABS1QB12_9FLAO|nr:hypothetical protein [Chryseobacterium endalhagicum]MBL1219799.1 hypothetical protein [Chryseobacterium endalhagicum]